MRVAIKADDWRVAEVELAVGHSRIFRQGTDRRLFVDMRDRVDADLMVIRLNSLPGVKASILDDEYGKG